MRAVILAAGLGSRLGERANGRPKALQEVGGATLIEHQLEGQWQMIDNNGTHFSIKWPLIKS